MSIKVIDLIKKLEAAPPLMEVMLDVSKQTGGVFQFASVNEASVIKDSLDDEYFILSPFALDEQPDQN